MTKPEMKKYIQHHGIHEMINQRMKQKVAAYVMTINDFPGSIGNLHPLKKQIPRYLRYGGYRNTCYDYRFKKYKGF